MGFKQKVFINPYALFNDNLKLGLQNHILLYMQAVFTETCTIWYVCGIRQIGQWHLTLLWSKKNTSLTLIKVEQIHHLALLTLCRHLKPAAIMDIK